MLKYFIAFVIFATFVAGNNPKYRIVNGKQIGRIVNGRVDNPGTFPFVVYLRIVRYFTQYYPQWNRVVTFTSKGRCGGSIIRADLVLTAAHCVKNTAPQNITAFAGIVHVTMEQPSAQFIRGRRIVSHEHYRKHWKNDIALVFLVESFELSAHVNTIALGRPYHYRGGMNVRAAGWGRDETGVPTDWLYRGDFTMLDRYACAYDLVGYEKYEELLCAIDPNQLQKVCTGDSGGPLVSNNALVGISVGTFEPNNVVTRSESCDPTRHSIFTNVSHYRTWMDREIRHDNMYFRYA